MCIYALGFIHRGSGLWFLNNLKSLLQLTPKCQICICPQKASFVAFHSPIYNEMYLNPSLSGHVQIRGTGDSLLLLSTSLSKHVIKDC